MQDVEEECNDVKRVTPTRGTGSKRSRAAEVHNLSERVSLLVTRTRFLLHIQNLAVFFGSYVDPFLNFCNSDVETGSMRRCVHCKNSYQIVIRLAYRYLLMGSLLLDIYSFNLHGITRSTKLPCSMKPLST